MKPRTEWKSALRRNAGIIGESLLVAAGLSMVLYRVALSYNPLGDLAGSVPRVVKTGWWLVGLMHQHEGIRTKTNQPP